jgi:hypothetical protein
LKYVNIYIKDDENMPNLNMKAEAYEILYKFYVIFITVTEGASSYEVKNFNEAKTLVAFTDSSKSVIIAGCLNTESVLTKGSITPQFPPSMGVFKTAGFLDPISDSYYSSYPSCTFCFSNHYVKDAYKHQYYDGYILDHVLVRGYRVLNSGTSHEQGQNKFVSIHCTN